MLIRSKRAMRAAETPGAEYEGGLLSGKPSSSPKDKKLHVKRSDIFDRISISLSPRQTVAFYILTFFALILITYLVGVIAIKLSLNFGSTYTRQFSSWSIPYVLWYMIRKMPGAFGISLLIGFYVALCVGNRYAKENERLDDDYYIRPAKKNWASSDWLNYQPAEIGRTFEITSQKKPVGMPLGVLNERLLCIPDSPKHYQFTNRNVCIIGLSGTGKTFGGLKPLILTKLAALESFVCSDTKGDIFKSYAALARELGYRVLVLAPGTWYMSDGWDMFREIVTAPLSRVYDLINNMVQTIMDTAGEKSKRGVDFWKANEQQLLRALIYYITRSPQHQGERTIKALMELLLSGTATISQTFAGLDVNDPAYYPSSNFRGSEEKIKESARTGLSGHLQIFETKAVHECLSYDTIRVEEAIEGPTAIFIVTPDFKEEYDVITSLFVSHVYTKLTEIADAREAKRLERSFFIIVDEICNMAAINDFPKIIATNRSRNIHFVFAIQSVGQLEERYGKLFDVIIGNCATHMFFGCGDAETAKMISERAGKVTVVEKISSMDANPAVPERLRRYQGSTRLQTREVDLLPPAKARELTSDELIICVAGKNVLKCSPYGENLHPLAGAAEEARKREEAKKEAEKREGIERWPAWLEHALNTGYIKEPPVDNTFEIADYERERTIYAYSLEERQTADAILAEEKRQRKLRQEEREFIEKSRLSPRGEVAVRIEKERRAKFDTAIIKGTQEENAYDELEELD